MFFPIKYRDLSGNARLDIKVWNARNIRRRELIGEATAVYDADAHISRVKGTGSQCYNVGGYYSVACRDEKTNEWVRTVTGTPSIRPGFPHANPEIVEE